jgi:hypothetical protein
LQGYDKLRSPGKNTFSETAFDSAVVSCTDSLARKFSCIYRYFAGAEVGERVGEGGSAGAARAGSFLKESSCVRGSSARAGNGGGDGGRGGGGGGTCADFSARSSSFVQERPETWAAPQATGELSVPVLLVTVANYVWVQKVQVQAPWAHLGFSQRLPN